MYTCFYLISKVTCMKQETTPINKLVIDFYDELDQRGYTKGSKWCYSKICRQILEWCYKNHITSFDMKIGNRFCDETIGGHISDVTRSYNNKKILRVVRMLITLQRDGDFEFRAPRIEYRFKTDLQNATIQYLNYCANKRELSKASLAERKRVLFHFDKFLYENNISMADITVNLFEHFLSICCSTYSRRYYKSILREFYRYLFDHEILSKDYSSFIMKEPKASHKSELPTTYTEEEIRRMINAIDRSSAKGKRDYLVLLLAAEYGLRASDITAFRLSQIDWDKNKISMFQYKTGVPIEFPLLSSVGNAVIDYIKHGRPIGGDDVIIVNHENIHKGKKLKSPTIHSIVAYAMKTANIKNWKHKKHGPHSLRHSLASNMLKQNVSIPIISAVLGHQSTETTKTYISVDLQKLRLCSLPIPKIRSLHYNIKIKPIR